MKLEGLIGARLQNMQLLVDELKPIIEPLSKVLAERLDTRLKKLQVEVDPNLSLIHI